VSASNPTVGVIIPTYNRSDYLRLTLQSVLAQTRQPDEILVVDDGSTDDTLAVCAEFPQARVLRQANQRQAAARNTGIQASRADLLFFLDDDDLLLEDTLEAQLAVFQERPEVDVVYGRSLRINGRGDVIGEDLLAHRQPRRFAEALLEENFVRIQTALVRREAVQEIGGFDPDVVPCEDYDLWLRLALAGNRFHYLPRFLARYRTHEGSVSQQRERMARVLLQVAQKLAPQVGTAAVAGAHYRLGRLLLDEGRMEEAAEAFREAVRNQPGSARYRTYAFLAARPALMGTGFRLAQGAKRLLMAGLAKAGIVERRWGS